MLQIVHGIGLALEKGQDQQGACACAQADIKSFYDDLPMPLLRAYMVGLGIPIGFVAVCLRLQLIPTIMLGVVGTEITMQRRTKGGVTGRRVARVLSRIRIYDMIKKREPIWRDCGLKLHDAEPGRRQI